jgi:hypothetical protein
MRTTTTLTGLTLAACITIAALSGSASASRRPFVTPSVAHTDTQGGRTQFATVINAGGDWAVSVGMSAPGTESKSNKKKWALASKKLAQAQLKKSEAFIQTRVG